MRLGRQFLCFSAIGLVNTAVQFALFSLLYRWLGVPLLLASALGYAAGVANSYWMNRAWTFAAAGAANRLEFSRFVLVNLVSLGLNLATLQFLAGQLGLVPELAQLGAIGMSLAANFSGNRFWTFRVSR